LKTDHHKENVQWKKKQRRFWVDSQFLSGFDISSKPTKEELEEYELYDKMKSYNL
jgi:hypothetical protein